MLKDQQERFPVRLYFRKLSFNYTLEKGRSQARLGAFIVV